MENNRWGQYDESFESVTQPLSNFVSCAAKLPESAREFSDYYGVYRCLSIESRIKKYLSDPHNIETLKHWIDLLKNVSDKIIEKSYPDENWDDGTIISLKENREEAKEQIIDTIDFITEMLQDHKKLKPKPKHYSRYSGNSLYLVRMKDKLVENRMIDDTPYFSEIFKGKANNRFVNWIAPITYFRYFIVELFNTELFFGKQRMWKIAQNSFTIHGLPVPKNIRTRDDKIDDNAQTIIDKIIKDLKNQ